MKNPLLLIGGTFNFAIDVLTGEAIVSPTRRQAGALGRRTGSESGVYTKHGIRKNGNSCT